MEENESGKWYQYEGSKLLGIKLELPERTFNQRWRRDSIIVMVVALILGAIIYAVGSKGTHTLLYALAIAGIVFLFGSLNAWYQNRHYLLDLEADQKGLGTTFLLRKSKMKHYATWDGISLKRKQAFSRAPSPILVIKFRGFGGLRFYSENHRELPRKIMDELIGRLEDLKRQAS
ncbi:MAG: hypothetical protein U0T82_07640 [Bacteroidales bacterium]